MSNATQITYDEAAALLEVSPRQARTVLTQHAEICPPLKYGHRTVRFALDAVLLVKATRRAAALRTVSRRSMLPRGKATR